MEYSSIKKEKVSRLGFGAMRFPLKSKETGEIDEEKTFELIDYAMAHGINYYDTAFSYLGGNSERVLGRALARYPRESFLLASKLPGHEINPDFNPQLTFETQLKKCGVDYFDFYLLHNVCENSIDRYLDEKLDIPDGLLDRKDEGKIRHLGFSTHANYETLRHFLDMFPNTFDFCQIQLNYLDWNLQEAGEKYNLLTERGLDVIVMEPVRGGALCDLGEANNAKLKALRPDESIASWGFRFAKQLDNVKVILSGMSSMDQLKDNIKTFETNKPLNATELTTLLQIANGMTDKVPCTACRYCTKYCPQGLDIPYLLSLYNDIKFHPSLVVSMAIDALPPEKRPSACLGCGKCGFMCPQKIAIKDIMQDFTARLPDSPDWKKICEDRAESAKAQLKAGK